MDEPPRIIDGALVQAFAICDASVRYTDKSSTYHDGKPIGNVPGLALCRDMRTGDLLLFYCDENWETLGARGFESLEQAKQQAQMEYEGLSSRWRDTNYTRADLLPEDLQPQCSFCGTPWFEADGLIKGDNAFICYKCVKRATTGVTKIENGA
ncbi:MAG: ClpX C4-type zinc finger protein [Pseudomonadota bacterium]|nr:MAG: ClpX C4-type zinc finger protein [Pseudomonadota bacterium]